MSYLRVSQVADQLNVSPHTVRLYARQGKIRYDRTVTGHRVFKQEYVDEFKGIKPTPIYAFYARSSSGDKALIESQLAELKAVYGEPEFVYKDSGSGLNENRKGLQKLLKDAATGKFNTVCVTYEDRLSRFGLTYLRILFERSNVKLNVLHEKTTVSLQEELMDDFMKLIASFSGRFYQLRSNENQRKLLDKAGERL